MMGLFLVYQHCWPSRQLVLIIATDTGTIMQGAGAPIVSIRDVLHTELRPLSG
jgi:hypothetical protein